MSNAKQIISPDCASGWTRHNFVRAALLAATPLARRLSAAPTASELGDHQAEDRRVLLQGPAGDHQRNFRGVTSPDGYERFIKQRDDDVGGLGQYHVALFGTPGSGKFEFEMTGRHVTIRADGDSVENVAFGGPIVYGHGEGAGEAGLPGNVFYYQTKKANEVFAALDGSSVKRR